MTPDNTETIRFSSDYPKLWGQKTAKLIHVTTIQREQMHADLIEYDTKNKRGEYYPLPNATYLQLIFLGDKGIPFCTIRRKTAAKHLYYLNQVGINLKIVVEGTK